MTDLLAQAADEFAPLPFLDEGGNILTFGEVDRVVTDRAEELAAGQVAGLRPRIDAKSVVEILATLRSGSQAVLVPASWPVARAAENLAALPPPRWPEIVVFTSGSSGAPKPVRLTEANWAAAGANSAAAFDFGPQRRWLVVLPLFHVGGLAVIFRSLMSGGTAVLAQHFDPQLLEAVDLASLVPTQLSRLVAERNSPRASILIGGGSLSPDLVEKARGWTLHRTYGMSETAAVVASGSAASEWMTMLPRVEIDQTDGGLLRVRGPQVSPGYVGAPDRAPGDWFVTSDLGRVRGNEVSVVGRADRIINTGGEKVDPAEIEVLLGGHPGVTDVAAYGVKDEQWGEVVALLYVGTAKREEVAAAVEAELGAVARPRRIARVGAIPRDELGKTDTSALAALQHDPDG